jgi:hypothetical protein
MISTASTYRCIQFENVLPNDRHKTTGAFSNLDGSLGAVELASTAFNATRLNSQQRLFILEFKNSVRADFYTGSTTCAGLLAKSNHRYTSVITNVAKLAR